MTPEERQEGAANLRRLGYPGLAALIQDWAPIAVEPAKERASSPIAENIRTVRDEVLAMMDSPIRNASSIHAVADKLTLIANAVDAMALDAASTSLEAAATNWRNNKRAEMIAKGWTEAQLDQIEGEATR